MIILQDWPPGFEPLPALFSISVSRSQINFQATLHLLPRLLECCCRCSHIWQNSMISGRHAFRWLWTKKRICISCTRCCCCCKMNQIIDSDWDGRSITIDFFSFVFCYEAKFLCYLLWSVAASCFFIYLMFFVEPAAVEVVGVCRRQLFVSQFLK